MNDRTPRMADVSPATNSHLHVVASTEPLAVISDVHAAAYMKFLVDLRLRGFFPHLNSAEFGVLCFLLESLDVKSVARGELITRPISRDEIAKGCQRWAGTAGRNVQELMLHGLVVLHAGGRGGLVNSYRLRMPAHPFHKRLPKHPTEAQKSAQARQLKVCRGAKGLRVGTAINDVQARQSICAPAHYSAPDTTDYSSSSEEGEERGDAAAAFELLKDFDFAPADIPQILNYPTASLEVVMAACMEGKMKGDNPKRFGLVRTLIREPDRINPSFMKRANRKIHPSEPARLPDMQPEPAASEEERAAGIALVKAALKGAN